MKVLNICVDDWANFMLGQHKALLSVGVDSQAIKMNRHVFNYPNQAATGGKDTIKRMASEADVVIIYHSDFELLPLIPQGKPVLIYHTGTKFRQNAKGINNVVNQVGAKVLIALPEFAKKTQGEYIVGAVDTSELLYTPFKMHPLKIGHFPSNPDVKGTSDIRKVFGSITKIYTRTIIDEKRVNYDEHIKRIAEVDVYVEMLAPKQGNQDYGSFGMTALEAAAMGKIVVTQNVTGQDLYRNTYGDTPMLFVNDAESMLQALNKLLDTSSSELERMAVAHREWCEQKHGLQATGRKLLEVLRGL